MNFNILGNLDIFFIIIMAMLYIAFVFFAKSTESKFFVFFISSFINIFNYSIVLKNEHNFLAVVMLNIMFMFIMIFFYIYCDINNNILPSDFIESNDIKNIITIIIFLVSFFSLCFIFGSLYLKKSTINKNIQNNEIIFNNNTIIKNNNKKKEMQLIEINDIKYLIYNRNISFIDNNTIFHNYNLIILFYILVLMASFFINNSNTKK